MKNKVQLCTYVDRLGKGDISQLHTVVQQDMQGLFGGVHLLPFYYPIDGADAGFDPIDHGKVDERLGAWPDVKALAQGVDIMADLIVNHMSSDSAQFKDFYAKGEQSDFAELFLTYKTVFPSGASEEELNTLYRPRPGLPFTKMKFADGEHRLLWTTFTAKQIDIDVQSAAGKQYLASVLDALQSGGVTMIRLDAAGYALKKAGTSCFMTEQTFEFIAELTRDAAARGMEVLVEIHSHYLTQVAIAKHASWVYDFALPPLVLHALHFADATPLKRWYEIGPRNCINVLDTHDGIGIIDVAAEKGVGEGLLDDTQIDALVEKIHAASGEQSRKATGAAASNVDLYQVNCTYYSALGEDDQAYLLARLLQFFSPGIPQVYYMGLLAGENDMALLQASNVGRDINRHYYTREEIQQSMARPVVKTLCALIRLRNQHPAFQTGKFQCMKDRPEHEIAIAWLGDNNEVEVHINLQTKTMQLRSRMGDDLCVMNSWEELEAFVVKIA